MADSRSGMLTSRYSYKTNNRMDTSNSKIKNRLLCVGLALLEIRNIRGGGETDFVKYYLVFEVLFLQVLYICDHLMDDWIKHGLEHTFTKEFCSS